MNDALDVRQADARALELLPAVQALKHTEQFAGITRIETRPVVPNENDRLVVATGSATDLDCGLAASAGELHGIGENSPGMAEARRPNLPLAIVRYLSWQDEENGEDRWMSSGGFTPLEKATGFGRNVHIVPIKTAGCAHLSGNQAWTSVPWPGVE